MLTEEQLELFGNRFAGVYQGFEQDLIADIARRVKKTGRYTETAELMAQSMKRAGVSPDKIRAEVMQTLRADKAYQDAVAKNTLEYKRTAKREIKEMRAEARRQGNEIIAEAGDMSFNYDLAMWEQAGDKLTKDSAIVKMVEEMSKDTDGTMRNLTRTMGFKGAHDFMSVDNAYQKSLDKAVLKMSTGTFSFDQAVNDCVRELAQSGLRTVDYASGRTYQLDTAARMCVRTLCHQLSAKISMRNCDTTGTDLVEVSAHWGAREDHAVWQGKIYSRSGKSKKYPSFDVCRYGEVDGLCGVNCRHTFYPFFEGISEPNHWPAEPKPKDFNGKTYTYTDATQKQRQMERSVRATKREIEAQKAIGGDTTILEAKKRRQIQEYHEFSKAMDIRAKDNRLRVVAGSSDLNRTNTMRWIQEQYTGYIGTIPKTWEKIAFNGSDILVNTNPKFVKNPQIYDKEQVKYSNNCVNSTVAYEMRRRGFNVIAGKSNSKLRRNPMMAWEDVQRIECVANPRKEIEEQLKKWGDGARATVCMDEIPGRRGHAIVAENIKGEIMFLDPQVGRDYPLSAIEERESVWYFRTDNAIISQRGVNACERIKL